MEIDDHSGLLLLPLRLQEMPSNEVENQVEARQDHELNEGEMQEIHHVIPVANAVVVDQWFELLDLSHLSFSQP